MFETMTQSKKKTTKRNQNDYFEITSTESISNKSEFKRFLNWISAEYELNLQDNQNGLKIYFPWGFLKISEKDYENKVFNFRISIQSKYELKANQTKNQVLSILKHLKHLY